MAVRAIKAAGLELQPANQTTEVRDFNQVAEFAKAAVSSLNQAGIVEGDATALFHPTRHSSRAEAAKVLYMILSLAE